MNASGHEAGAQRQGWGESEQKPIERAAKRCDFGGMSERLTMRKIREVLRLKDSGRSQREIASSLCVAVGTICGYLKRSREAGLTWERAQLMTDAEIDAVMFRDGGRNTAATRAAIDYAHVHSELRRTTTSRCGSSRRPVSKRRSRALLSAYFRAGTTFRTTLFGVGLWLEKPISRVFTRGWSTPGCCTTIPRPSRSC